MKAWLPGPPKDGFEGHCRPTASLSLLRLVRSAWQHGNWTPPSACLCFPSLFSRCCYQGNSVIYILHAKLSQNGLPGELNHYGQETDLPPQKSCRVFPVAVLVANKGDTQRGAREVLSVDFQWRRKTPQEKEVGMTCSPSRKCPCPGTTLPRLKKLALSLTSLVTGQVT